MFNFKFKTVILVWKCKLHNTSKHQPISDRKRVGFETFQEVSKTNYYAPIINVQIIK